MPLKLITAPAAEPVSLADAKAHLRVDHAADDDLIAALIAAAREDAEHRLGRALVMQTLEQVCDAFPADGDIELPNPPLASVTSVKYLDSDGVEQTLSTSLYDVDSDSAPGEIHRAYGVTWPSTRCVENAVRARYVAGYAATYAITGISKATSAVVTIGTHTIPVGQRVHFSGVLGMTQINGLSGTVTAVGASTITVDIDSSAYGTWSAGGVVCVDAVPAPIKQWILLRIGALYEQRESVFAGQAMQAAPRDFADGLLDRYKVYC